MNNLTTNLKKVRNVFLATLFLAISAKGYAQADGINYQAAIRDGSGELVKNTAVDIKFTISEDGTVVYVEEHTGINSSDQGLVNVVIGDGTPSTGTFNDVEWSNNKQEDLEVEVDLGSGYVSMGSQDFQAVPYALNVPWTHYSSLGLRYYDTTKSSTRVGISADETLTSNQNLLELYMPNGSDDNAQFIDFYNGSSGSPFFFKTRVARINADGSAHLKNVEVDTLGEADTPNKSTLYGESMPMAWGYIQGAATYSGFGISNVSINSSTSKFTITLDNSWIGKPAVIVTPVTSGNAEIPGVNIVPDNSNKFTVIFNTTSNSKKSTDFMVVVYGRTK